MNPIPRSVVVALLALMQFLAPWLHAHSGGETGGFPHLPGLERLDPPEPRLAAAAEHPAVADLVVGMQTGVSCPLDRASPRSGGDAPAVLAPAEPSLRHALTAVRLPMRLRVRPARNVMLGAAPRAPPARSASV